MTSDSLRTLHVTEVTELLKNASGGGSFSICDRIKFARDATVALEKAVELHGITILHELLPQLQRSLVHFFVELSRQRGLVVDQPVAFEQLEDTADVADSFEQHWGKGIFEDQHVCLDLHLFLLESCSEMLMRKLAPQPQHGERLWRPAPGVAKWFIKKKWFPGVTFVEAVWLNDFEEGQKGAIIRGLSDAIFSRRESYTNYFGRKALKNLKMDLLLWRFLVEALLDTNCDHVLEFSLFLRKVNSRTIMKGLKEMLKILGQEDLTARDMFRPTLVGLIQKEGYKRVCMLSLYISKALEEKLMLDPLHAVLAKAGILFLQKHPSLASMKELVKFFVAAGNTAAVYYAIADFSERLLMLDQPSVGFVRRLTVYFYLFAILECISRQPGSITEGCERDDDLCDLIGNLLRGLRFSRLFNEEPLIVLDIQLAIMSLSKHFLHQELPGHALLYRSWESVATEGERAQGLPQPGPVAPPRTEFWASKRSKDLLALLYKILRAAQHPIFHNTPANQEELDAAHIRVRDSGEITSFDTLKPLESLLDEQYELDAEDDSSSELDREKSKDIQPSGSHDAAAHDGVIAIDDGQDTTKKSVDVHSGCGKRVADDDTSANDALMKPEDIRSGAGVSAAGVEESADNFPLHEVSVGHVSDSSIGDEHEESSDCSAAISILDISSTDLEDSEFSDYDERLDLDPISFLDLPRLETPPVSDDEARSDSDEENDEAMCGEEDDTPLAPDSGNRMDDADEYELSGDDYLLDGGEEEENPTMNI